MAQTVSEMWGVPPPGQIELHMVSLVQKIVLGEGPGHTPDLNWVAAFLRI